MSSPYKPTRSLSPLNEYDDYKWHDQQANPDPIGHVWTKEVGVITCEPEYTNQRTKKGPARVT